MNQRYSVILADPPWDFRVWSKATGQGRSAESHYRTLDYAALAALPVQNIADDVSTLFLWCVMPRLPDAIELMKAWGFTYKTVAFAWAKSNKVSPTAFFGLGYWTRANVELVLLGTRKNPKRVRKDVSQLVVAPVGRHSAKPPEVRDRIVQLMGDVPRVELFARDRAPGWDAIGLEIDGRDIRDVLSSP